MVATKGFLTEKLKGLLAEFPNGHTCYTVFVLHFSFHCITEFFFWRARGGGVPTSGGHVAFHGLNAGFPPGLGLGVRCAGVSGGDQILGALVQKCLSNAQFLQRAWNIPQNYKEYLRHDSEMQPLRLDHGGADQLNQLDKEIFYKKSTASHCVL